MDFLEELIKNAEAVNKKTEEKHYEVSIKRFDELGIKGKVKVKKPDTTLIASFVERGNNSAYLLSEVMIEPNLADKKLQEAYGVKGAKVKEDLLKKIFNSEEILDLDRIVSAISQSGRAATLVDDIKN